MKTKSILALFIGIVVFMEFLLYYLNIFFYFRLKKFHLLF